MVNFHSEEVCSCTQVNQFGGFLLESSLRMAPHVLTSFGEPIKYHDAFDIMNIHRDSRPMCRLSLINFQLYDKNESSVQCLEVDSDFNVIVDTYWTFIPAQRLNILSIHKVHIYSHCFTFKSPLSALHDSQKNLEHFSQNGNESKQSINI